jgi:hypothetical protein
VAATLPVSLFVLGRLVGDRPWGGPSWVLVALLAVPPVGMVLWVTSHVSAGPGGLTLVQWGWRRRWRWAEVADVRWVEDRRAGGLAGVRWGTVLDHDLEIQLVDGRRLRPELARWSGAWSGGTRPDDVPPPRLVSFDAVVRAHLGAPAPDG